MFTRLHLAECIKQQVLTGPHNRDRKLPYEARLQLEVLGITPIVEENHSAFVTETKLTLVNKLRERVVLFSVTDSPSVGDIITAISKVANEEWRVMA